MKEYPGNQIYKTLRFFIFILVSVSTTNSIYAQKTLDQEPWLIQLDGKEINNVELLCSYLQIPSVSGNEKKAGQFLKSVCEQNGLYIQQLGEQEGNYNFAASLYPLDSNKPNIIFLNHIDVVPTGALSDWTYHPFQGQVVDDVIWGRGALDMKGVAVAQLFGLLKFKSTLNNSDFDYNITLLAVSAEEIISEYGASYVVENHLDQLNPAVVFCEGPTGMKGIIQSDKELEVFGISVADKKPLWLKLRLTQNSFAHGASSPKHYPAKDLTLALNRLLSTSKKIIYNDINVGMLKDLGRMEKGIPGFVMRYPRLFKPLIASQIRKDSRLMIFFTNTITLIDYNTVSHSANSLPQSIECRLDCRLMPDQETSEFIANINNIIQDSVIEIIVSDSLPGTPASPEDNFFYSNYKSAIKTNFPLCEVVPAILPGYSDCIQFRCKGIPSFGSNPFSLSSELLSTFHNFNERIPVAALNAGTNVYHDFLLELAKNQ